MLGSRTIIHRFTGFPSDVIKRFAGHSKWANIKHTKLEKDGARARLFSKFGQKMKIAIAEGGSNDPSKNLALSQAIEIAKKNNMPLSSIQNYIKAPTSEKDKQKVLWLEVRGPRGVFIIVQAITSTPKLTKDNVASILRRNGFSYADNIRNMFDFKGVIIANPPDNKQDVIENAVDDAIECGAEEVVSTEDGTPEEQQGKLKFICHMQEVNILKTKLERKTYDVVSAEIDLIPKMRVEVDDAEIEAISKLFEKLEDHPDVVKIFDNIA